MNPGGEAGAGLRYRAAWGSEECRPVRSARLRPLLRRRVDEALLARFDFHLLAHLLDPVSHTLPHPPPGGRREHQPDATRRSPPRPPRAPSPAGRTRWRNGAARSPMSSSTSSMSYLAQDLAHPHLSLLLSSPAHPSRSCQRLEHLPEHFAHDVPRRSRQEQPPEPEREPSADDEPHGDGRGHGRQRPLVHAPHARPARSPRAASPSHRGRPPAAATQAPAESHCAGGWVVRRSEPKRSSSLRVVSRRTTAHAERLSPLRTSLALPRRWVAPPRPWRFCTAHSSEQAELGRPRGVHEDEPPCVTAHPAHGVHSTRPGASAPGAGVRPPWNDASSSSTTTRACVRCSRPELEKRGSTQRPQRRRTRGSESSTRMTSASSSPTST